MPAGNLHVKALFEYSSAHEDDLQFGIGQIITVTDEDDEEWYTGEYVDDNGNKQEGIFPRNFVEKYEPTAPPRPTRRAKKEPEPAALEESPAEVAPPAPPSPKAEEAPAHLPASAPQVEAAIEEPRPASPPARANPAPPAAPVPEPAKAHEPVPKDPTAQAKPAPPPVAAKSGSIRDRIAAFNKPGAAPVTPFKPSSLNYVKKPFVPPPPSRDAYVPPPRAEPPPRMYVREEEAESNVDEPETQEAAINAAPVASTSYDTAASTEDQPKPTSLQERIAILQKQQAEAAQRHADAIAKKEKPKAPQKKRTGSSEASQTPDLERSVTLERHDTEGSEERGSLDEPRVALPSRRKASSDYPINDGNDADMSGAGDTTEGVEELTEREDNDEKPQTIPHRREGQEEQAGENESEGEEDEVDPEVRRKEELRARMAKMSGGMGMPGMFMPMPGPALPKKKKPSMPRDEAPAGAAEETSPAPRAAPPVPTMMALPGMSTRQSMEQSRDEPPEPEPSTRPPPPAPPRRQSSIVEEPGRDEDDDATPLPHSPASPPPVPGGRPAPPPVPTSASAPRPTSPVKSPSAGSVSDDELSEHPRPQAPAETQAQAPPPVTRSPPPPPPSLPSPTLPTSPRFSAMPPPVPGSEDAGPTSPTSPAPPVPSKRNSRPPPPIPGTAPVPPPAHTRPPPPPPPGQSSDSGADTVALPTRPPPRPVDEEAEATEYEGDYDTDIASSAPPKDALKSTSREAPPEDDFTHGGSPVTDFGGPSPPPLPTSGPPKTVPPPVPGHTPPGTRPSVDVPRSAPPPPPTKEPEPAGPYASHGHNISMMGSSSGVSYEDETGVPEVHLTSNSPERKALPTGPPPSRLPPRQSMDAQRTMGRASVDVGRGSVSMDTGFIAEDIDLASQTGWWQQSNQVPPVLQGRKDIVFETDESTSTNRGAKTVITRTISVLFIDYSKTIITVQYDPYDPSDVQIDQYQEPPPRSLRQDQLENSYDRFGRAIADMASSKKDTVVGDGTPQGLIHELLRPFKDALRPVGTRAYGALVYANMANASTLLHDEIRPGDVISFRNTRFQGKHGAMHAKYSAEVGKPDHVGVVAEWDGTKKKVRAWEQGRESRKVKMESFKLDDLRSGEVKVWRVMPRSWVGWSTTH